MRVDWQWNRHQRESDATSRGTPRSADSHKSQGILPCHQELCGGGLDLLVLGLCLCCFKLPTEWFSVLIDLAHQSFCCVFAMLLANSVPFCPARPPIVPPLSSSASFSTALSHIPSVPTWHCLLHSPSPMLVRTPAWVQDLLICTRGWLYLDVLCILSHSFIPVFYLD